jgi:hypothetical protein
MSTYQAVMKTFADFGYPVGIPFALLQAAVGAKQIQQILSTKPKSGGGSVSSSSISAGTPTIPQPQRPVVPELESAFSGRNQDGMVMVSVTNRVDESGISSLVERGSISRRKTETEFVSD